MEILYNRYIKINDVSVFFYKTLSKRIPKMFRHPLFYWKYSILMLVLLTLLAVPLR
jgi:hypothetical protein